MKAEQRKSSLRTEVAERLREIDRSERQRSSGKIVEKILGTPIWKQCTAVLAYIPLASETDISSLIKKAFEQNIFVAVSRVDDDKLTFCQIKPDYEKILVKGSLGVHEPPKTLPPFDIKRHESVLCIVPGVAFSISKERMGRGKGYYDRFLSAEGSSVFKMGVCFDTQIEQKLPVDSFDVPMDMIISERRIIV